MPHAFPTRRSSDLEKLGTTDDKEIDAATRSILAQFEGYAKLNKKIPAELLPSLASMDAPGRLADTIAAHLNLKLEDKQEVLGIDDAQARLEHVRPQQDHKNGVLTIEKKNRPHFQPTKLGRVSRRERV